MLCLILLVGSVIVPVSASAAKKNVKMLKVTVDGARVRKGPSSAYDVITSVKKGSIVFYNGKTKNAFCYICTSGGKKGYVYKGFLQSYGAAPSNQYYRAKSKVKVYKKASTGAKKVTTLSKGQYVVVYQIKGKWAYIKTLNGKGGYVKASSLKKAK